MYISSTAVVPLMLAQASILHLCCWTNIESRHSPSVAMRRRRASLASFSFSSRSSMSRCSYLRSIGCSSRDWVSPCTLSSHSSMMLISRTEGCKGQYHWWRHLYLRALQSLMPSMMEAWFSLSLRTASSAVKMLSNKPALASKQEGNRIVSAVPWNSVILCSSCLCRSCSTVTWCRGSHINYVWSILRRSASNQLEPA